MREDDELRARAPQPVVADDAPAPAAV
jgi:hypothetical protein